MRAISLGGLLIASLVLSAVAQPGDAHIWFKNVGTRTQPKLMGPLNVEVEWRGQQPKLAWNGDDKLDLMQDFNNAKWWKQVRDENGKWYFRDMGPVAPNWIQWHSTSPCAEGKPVFQLMEVK